MSSTYINSLCEQEIQQNLKLRELRRTYLRLKIKYLNGELVSEQEVEQSREEYNRCVEQVLVLDDFFKIFKL